MSPPILLEELLMEILSWVPVKDLMRFRCVTKWWNSLVFDPTFVKLHLQRSPENTHILLTIRENINDRSSYFAPCSISGLLQNPSSTIEGCHRFKHDYLILGVCNGLVCLLDSHWGPGDAFMQYWFRLWNPATRLMSQDSPRIPLRSNHNTNDDYPYPYMFGFGYDDWSDTYQVVVLDCEPQKMEVKVHCLGDTCWKNTLTCHAFPVLSPVGVFASGTVNWLALPNLSYVYEWESVTINELAIFSFDLKNESYRYLSMPDGLLEVPPSLPKLKVLKGCLCLSLLHRMNQFGFWLMKESGVEKSWTHLLNISYDQLHIHTHIHGPLYLFPAHPVILCMSEDDDIMLLERHRKFFLYNKRDNTIEREGDLDEDIFQLLSYDYVQSLVMPYRN